MDVTTREHEKLRGPAGDPKKSYSGSLPQDALGCLCGLLAMGWDNQFLVSKRLTVRGPYTSFCLPQRPGILWYTQGKGTLMYKAASWSRIMVLMKGYMSSPIWEEGRKIDGDTKTSQAPFWSSRHVCANSPPQHPGLSSDRRDLSPHALGDSHCEMRSCEMRLSLCFSRWGWRVPKVASCQSWAGLKLEPLGGQEQLKS